MEKKKRKDIEEFSKNEKIKFLRMFGWYELKSKNNWVEGINVPKNWRGIDYENAFEKLYKKNKYIK